MPTTQAPSYIALRTKKMKKRSRQLPVSIPEYNYQITSTVQQSLQIHHTQMQLHLGLNQSTLPESPEVLRPSHPTKTGFCKPETLCVRHLRLHSGYPNQCPDFEKTTIGHCQMATTWIHDDHPSGSTMINVVLPGLDVTASSMLDACHPCHPLNRPMKCTLKVEVDL